jgi:hypothetical protein
VQAGVKVPADLASGSKDDSEGAKRLVESAQKMVQR